MDDLFKKNLRYYPTPPKSKKKEPKQTPKKNTTKPQQYTLSQSRKKSAKGGSPQSQCYFTPQRKNKYFQHLPQYQKLLAEKQFQQRNPINNKSPQKQITDKKEPQPARKIHQQHINADKNTQEYRNLSTYSKLQKHATNKSQNSSNNLQRISRSTNQVIGKSPIAKKAKQIPEKEHEKKSKLKHSSHSPQKQLAKSPLSYANQHRNKNQQKITQSHYFKTIEKEKAKQIKRSPEKPQQNQFKKELINDNNYLLQQKQTKNEYIQYGLVPQKMVPDQDYINCNQIVQFKQNQKDKSYDKPPEKSEIQTLTQNITDNQSQNYQISNHNQNKNQNITPNSKFVSTEYKANLNLQRDSYKKIIDNQNYQQIHLMKVQKVDQNEERLKQQYKELKIVNQERNSQELGGINGQEIKQEFTQNTIQDLNTNQFQQTSLQIPKVIKKERHKNQKLLIYILDHCDYIELQFDAGNPNIYFVLSKFTVYTGQFNKKTSKKEGNGLILQRQFDQDFNSSYFQYQGEFQNDQIVGRGRLFQHKSKRVLQEGEWSSIQEILGRQPNIAIKPRISKIKILNVTNLKDGSPETKVQRQRIFDLKATTGFHDHMLNQNDLTILINKAWLNSSIIDAYVEHLNYKDEEHYWTLNMEQRKLYKRLQIIPSWLFTWFHQGQDPGNLKQFQQIYAQYEPIGFRIWEIYRKIGVVIDQSNVHWYFVQLDFEKMEILILDSMRGSEYKYKRTVDILQKLFEQIDQSVKFTVKVCQDCEQQRNGYDCGAYTCINAKKLADNNLGNTLNGPGMRKLLLDFIQYQKNQ